MRYIKVAFPKSPLESLTYSVPKEYPEIGPGMRVVVPVGPRFLTAFVVQTDAPSSDEYDVKPIVDVLDQENPFSPTLLKLTEWMADYYLAEWGDILKTALPPALSVQPQTLITLTRHGEKNSSAHAILQILHEKRRLPLKEIYKLFGHKGTFSQIRQLEEQGFLEIVAGKKPKRSGYNRIEVIQGSDAPTGEKEQAIYRFLQESGGTASIDALPLRFKNLAVA